MLLALVIVGVSASVLLATQASRPAGDASRRRARARRAALVTDHPARANQADIVSALCRQGVAVREARRVVLHAERQGVSAFTLWLALEHLGAAVLSVAVVADLTQRDLLVHVSEATSPDLDELRLFASANGLDLAHLGDASVAA